MDEFLSDTYGYSECSGKPCYNVSCVLLESCESCIHATGTGPIIRNRLLHIGFLIFQKFWIYPQAFSFYPSLADAN